MFSVAFPSTDEKPPNKVLLTSRVPWPHAMAFCLYFVLAYGGFATAIPIFAKLFQGLGIELPLLTRFFIATYWWLLPTFFLGAAALTIVRQFALLDGLRLRLTNLILIFVGTILVPLIIIAVYVPLFDLIWKLHHVQQVK